MKKNKWKETNRLNKYVASRLAMDDFMTDSAGNWIFTSLAVPRYSRYGGNYNISHAACCPLISFLGYLKDLFKLIL